MDFKLLYCRVCGIKNIEKEISLSFFKKTFDAKIMESSSIKAIYGPNGAGKSGIIRAFSFYKLLVTTSFPFKDPINAELFSELINKKNREFCINLAFAFCLGNRIIRVGHEIHVSLDKNSRPSISYERVYHLNSRMAEGTNAFLIKEGELIEGNLKEYSNLLNSVTLESNSFINLFIQEGMKLKGESFIDKRNVFDITNMAIYVALFANNLYIAFGDERDAYHNLSLNMFRSCEDVNTFLTALTKEHIDELFTSTSNYPSHTLRIQSKEKEHYKELVSRLSNFLFYLKPSLKRVQPHFVDDGVYSVMDLDFLYDDYTINMKYESTGIKKVCSIFWALNAASQGQITFIDEIDANIHDNFLVKLIEYFALYTDVQLIITTHNLELMSAIKPLRKSIDFLTYENTIVPWVKAGKLSPSVVYLKGYKEWTPWNLHSSEFSEIFSHEEKAKK